MTGGRVGIGRREDRGQGLVEYAILLLLVAIVVVASLTLFGLRTQAMFGAIVAAF